MATPPDTSFRSEIYSTLASIRLPRRYLVYLASAIVCSTLLIATISLLSTNNILHTLTDIVVHMLIISITAIISFTLAQRFYARQIHALRKQIEPAIDDISQFQPHQHHWAPLTQLSDSLKQSLTHHLDANNILNEQSHWFRRLAEDSLGIEAYFSSRGHVLWINRATETLTGYSREESLGTHDLIDLWVYAKDRPMLRELATRGLAGEERDEHELRIQHKDGQIRWFSCRWHTHHDDHGNIIGVRFSAQDIQRRKDAELKLLENVATLRRTQALKEHYLKRSNDEAMRLTSLLDTVDQGILFVDRDRRIIYINQACVDLWGLRSRDTLIGIRDNSLIEETRHLRRDDDAYAQHIEAVIASRQNSDPFDLHLRDGRIISQISSVVPAADGSRPIGRVWVFRDITIERTTEQQLTALAERDPLTGLFNRRRFIEEMERQIADANRRNEHIGLLSFDLDGFKPINDTFGHQAGDEVLVRIANEISNIVRRNELLFRLGGDEFAIVVPNTSTENMEQLARRVLTHVNQLQFKFNEQHAKVTLSMGIATTPQHATTLDGLIAAADQALYRAKYYGKNRWEVARLNDSHD